MKKINCKSIWKKSRSFEAFDRIFFYISMNSRGRESLVVLTINLINWTTANVFLWSKQTFEVCIKWNVNLNRIEPTLLFDKAIFLRIALKFHLVKWRTKPILSRSNAQYALMTMCFEMLLTWKLNFTLKLRFSFKESRELCWSFF